MYSNYTEYVKLINDENIKSINFKSNRVYTSILEHVTYDHGNKYLDLIQNDFSNITSEQILEFLNINDKYGYPTKYKFTLKNNENILCSPTSLRYIYHALLILKHYSKNNPTEIVEVGSGYGGLFLAICFFSKILNIKIKKYNFIDLPEICNLIRCYLSINNKNTNIEYEIHDSYTFGKNINSSNLFFVSNYCFTEINNNYREQYIVNLIPKCTNGFIIWQTVFGYEIENSYRLFNDVIITEETPQTANEIYKNYFVYF